MARHIGVSNFSPDLVAEAVRLCAEPLVGNEPGAGMGLVLVVTGGIILLLTLIVFAFPAIRQLEIQLPDMDVNASN